MAQAFGLLLALSGAAHAQNTNILGGTGGTSYRILCPEGEVLTRVAGWHGSWLDIVSAYCRKVNVANGSWEGGEHHAGSGGGDLATAFHGNILCPSGYAVKSFRAKYGSFVHRIFATCHKLGASGRTQGEKSEELWLGATGGPQTGGPISCSEAKPAIGIVGREGLYVDGFGLVCGYIMPGTPTLMSPAHGIDVTVRRPAFDWDPVPRITKPYRICINLSPGAGCSVSGTIKADIEMSKTQWTPAANLPFARGDMVYWRVDACNDNGCKYAVRAFRFMP
jgi:hypothetical protein